MQVAAAPVLRLRAAEIGDRYGFFPLSLSPMASDRGREKIIVRSE